MNDDGGKFDDARIVVLAEAGMDALLLLFCCVVMLPFALVGWLTECLAQGMAREARRREGGSGPSGLPSPVGDSRCAQTPANEPPSKDKP